MRRTRQPRIIWNGTTRPRVLARDGYQCVRCHVPVTVATAHIDHIVPLSRGGTNQDSNLRTLCRRCHVLRIDRCHRGLISQALRDKVIPSNYRPFMWSDIPEQAPHQA